MEENIKEIIHKWLEIEFYSIANKLNFIYEKKLPDKHLIYDTIRCLDYITFKKDTERVNTVIALVALMWTHTNKEEYDLRNVTIKFLSRIGYPTSAIIVDEKFDKRNCSFTSLNSWMDQITVGFNQLLNEVDVKGHTFMLADFQKRIWEAMDKEQVIGISAPTSAGKSFVILLKIIERISKGELDIVYIIPTLSLLNQVTQDFNNMLKKLNIKNYRISNTFIPDKKENLNNIYVLTQEKALSAFANEDRAFSNPLILIADEIQNIERIKDDRDERAKILFDMLMEFRYKENVEQIIISGPRIEDIGELGSHIFGVDAESISTEDSPVFNLTYSISKEENKYYFKQYCSLTENPICKLIDNTENILGYGKKKYDDNYLKCLLYWVEHIGKDEQNIIFAPTSATARKIACYLAKDNKKSEKNTELIEYYSKTVHEKYSLCQTLQSGVAYHHGKLPMHVRRTLEKAIAEKNITNVACTTTLMQGVNMPAQNVIVRNPHLYLKKTDSSVELSNYEMANLRGRAGRLLKDFIGRTYVLDESSFSDIEGYDQIDLFEDATTELPSGYEEKYEEYKREIEEVILSSKPVDETMNKYGYLVSYIRQSILRYGKDAKNKMKNVGIKLTSKQVAAIILKLDSLTVPREICIKNRYWDPYVLQSIYENYNEDVPKTPLERGAKAKIDRMFKFMRNLPETSLMYERHIPKMFRKGSQRSALVDLCMKWSKEKTLHEILSNKKYEGENGEDEIENTIYTLQNIVAFHVPLLLKPIFDIKNSESIFLTCVQAGAVHPITRKMIELGIPRETSIYLFENIFKDKKNKDTELIEEDYIRQKISERYFELPKWIKYQLDFLM